MPRNTDISDVVFAPLTDSAASDQTDQSLAERAYSAIRDAIVEGTLASGAAISERSLAAALGVSIQPVREALRRLDAEGLVETRPRSGTRVARLDDETLRETGLARAALEAVAAALAARRATEAELAGLERRLGAVVQATRLGDPQRIAAANDAFHQAIHAASGSLWINRALHSLRAYDHISRARLLSPLEEQGRALAEHAEVFDAIRARDATRAEAAMRAHTLRSLDAAFPDEAPHDP
ncbi:MAG: GntR family transcriptional regulator [Alphaproteobacteria bacterium]|nr:GntR family transcriptional regulator [Alphaproteobacteria bacterium]